MSVLNNLKLAVGDDRAKGYDPVRVRRKKLAAALLDQLHLLEASEAGGTYRKVKVKRARDLESDQVVDLEQQRRVTPWWWIDDDGVVKFSIRYGSARLKVKDGKDALILPPLRQEVLAGGLDDALAAAADALQARFQGAPADAKAKS